VIKSAYFSSFDGLRIRYHVIGDGPQKIVLANGHGGTVDVWAPVFERLPSRCQIIMWDYRNQHGSESAIRTPTIADHYGDLGALVKVLGLQRFALAGWSLGVQVALQGYRQHQGQVGALSLIHGAHDRLMDRVLNGRFRFLGKEAMLALAKIEPMLAPLYKIPARRLLNTRAAQPLFRIFGMAYKRQAYIQDMAKEFIELDLATYLRVACNANDHVTETWLNTVDVPVFLTVGTKDWLTPPKQLFPAFNALPNATLHIFDGGHFPILDAPERIAETLARAAEITYQTTGIER
jgi:pimeloyl-ACP methyl ester carboxylesterase